MPLLLAAEYGSEVVIELLLVWGDINPDPKSAFRDILLLQAATNRYKGVVKLLLVQNSISLNPKGFYN
jgi:hypothetical protein